MSPSSSPTPAKPKNTALTCCLWAAGVFVVLGIAVVVAISMGMGKLLDFAKEEKERKIRDIPGFAEFDAVTDSLAKGGAPGGAGNTEQATQIAKIFFAEYKAAHDAAFPPPAEDPMKMGGPDYATYCHLTDDAIVLVTNQPANSEFTEEQEAESANISWITANKVVRQVLGETDRELVIGLKTFVLFGEVITGQLDPEGEPLGGILSRDDSLSAKDTLYGYFAPPSSETEADAETESASDVETPASP